MAKETKAKVTLKAPNFQTATFTIVGTAAYVQHKFAAKARQQMKETQEAGHVAKKGKKKEGKNFQECYEQAKHISTEGWYGIPASGLRAALISACRLVDFAMTRAKLSIFVVADGADIDDGMPLVRITKGEPHYHEMVVRLPKGECDIHARAMWDAGWEAKPILQWDADQFSLTDVTNLLMRVGLQIGLGEGRWDSKDSTGLGWGTFGIKQEAQDESAIKGDAGRGRKSRRAG